MLQVESQNIIWVPRYPIRFTSFGGYLGVKLILRSIFKKTTFSILYLPWRNKLGAGGLAP